MPSELEGHVALVTGGGRGIGAGIARELASAGMRVAVTGRTREEVAWGHRAAVDPMYGHGPQFGRSP